MEDVDSQMHFFMFVNTKSGDGHGKCFIKLGYPEIVIRYQSNKQAHLCFFDLFQNQSRNKGLEIVKQYSQAKTNNFRVVIVGGDGTIPWVLGELLKLGVNLSEIVLGILPIGTGNDFSRSLGWGTDPIKVTLTDFVGLGRLVKIWMNATIGYYDMWDVTVQTFQNGCIYDIKDQQEIVRQQRSFTKMFSNYVGIGLDARVVYTVEQHRTPYAFLNKVAYGLVGFCNFFRRIKKLEDKVDTFREAGISLQDELVQQNQKETKNQKEKIHFESMQIDNRQKLLQFSQGQKKYPLKKGYCGLVCLNCTSYMAGLRKVWKTKSVAVKGRQNMIYKQQKVDDGMLQFVSFKTQLNLALERIIRSGAKVLQGAGPFQLKMKQPVQDQITHMQIDGQSIKIKNLKGYRITKTSKIPGHRLKVMVNLDQ